jgi:hypothetical protein
VKIPRAVARTLDVNRSTLYRNFAKLAEPTGSGRN